MKNILILAFLGVTFSLPALSQSTRDFLVGGGLDIVKTDILKVFDKAQVGAEAHYFVVRHFAVGAGIEAWSKQKNSFMLGMRWYATDNIFVRFRGLIGINDAVLGAGYSKAISKFWRLEGMGDYYFDASEFAVRAGVSYVIR